MIGYDFVILNPCNPLNLLNPWFGHEVRSPSVSRAARNVPRGTCRSRGLSPRYALRALGERPLLFVKGSVQAVQQHKSGEAGGKTSRTHFKIITNTYLTITR